MPSTPTHALPYPDSNGYVIAGPSDFAALALAADTALSAVADAADSALLAVANGLEDDLAVTGATAAALAGTKLTGAGRLAAGTAAVTGDVSFGAFSVAFGSTFGAPPVVVLTVLAGLGAAEPKTAMLTAVSTTGFDAQLVSVTDLGQSDAATVHWLAVGP